jgi:hypothetical protein
LETCKCVGPSSPRAATCACGASWQKATISPKAALPPVGALDFHEFLEHTQAAIGGVGPKQIKLSRDGEALSLLVLGGDAEIEN